MLTWRDIKEIVEEKGPSFQVTDDTRLSFIVVQGLHVGFGVLGQDGRMVSCNADGFLRKKYGGEQDGPPLNSLGTMQQPIKRWTFLKGTLMHFRGFPYSLTADTVLEGNIDPNCSGFLGPNTRPASDLPKHKIEEVRPVT